MANEHQLWARLGPGIVKSPDDDNLRLGFAEELEADDDIELKSPERAQFIYAQLALSSNPGRPEWMRLATEVESLLLDNKVRWIPGWYRTAGIRDPEFHRGFIECVTVSAEMLLETGGDTKVRLFEGAPIRHLDIVEFNVPNQLEDLLGTLETEGYLDRIISLRLDGQGFKDQHINHLNRKSLSQLRWLSLAENEIGQDGAFSLTGGNLTGLRFVELRGNPFDPTEKLGFDQGIVISRSLDHVPADLQSVRWIHRRVIQGLYFEPSRFETVRGHFAGRSGGTEKDRY